jgi:serine phosphatase RsbU (regulator of sigma subunit)
MGMSNNAIKSEAFQRAALKSEAYRVTGLLILLSALLAFAIVRGLSTEQYLLLALQTLVLAVIIVHEGIMLFSVLRTLRDGTLVQPSRWVFNVVIESQIPTIGLFLLLASNWQTPYQVMFAPVVLIYFLLIILSTLRLSPSLTLLSGLLSAVGYLFTFLYTELRFQGSAAILVALPKAVYVAYAGLIFCAGIIGAFVASRIRTHVTAALREADLEKEIAQINHDLEIARSIQQGLLPEKDLGLEQFDIAGWNKPADQTGGDYFDWQALPDGTVAISLADATGHGIGPALVGASCRAYARASFLTAGARNGVLENLNGLLATDLSANRFVTFAVIFLNPKNGAVRVLSAGHGPILWYKHKGKEIENLEAQGIPLGMIAGAKYSQGIEGQLDQGDILALVTDGFYEWTNPEGEEFGLTRLEDTIRESHHLSAEKIIEKLRSAVGAFCRGTKQQDDLTAVILKRSNIAPQLS